MVKILNYIYYNFSLAAVFNTYDGYVNGNGYKYYLSQKVLIDGKIVATVYHRWCNPFGNAIYCVESTDNFCIWDVTEENMLPLTPAAQLFYEI